MKSLAYVLAGCAALVPAGVTAEPGATQSDPSIAHSLAEIRFQFDSSVLTADAKSVLRPAATYATEHPSARIVLDAHCDPIGSAPYNAGLAVRRAESVRQELISAGVPEEQIVLSIYGEDGARRATYAEDRRVSLWWTREPLAVVADRAFAARGTAVRWAKPLSVAEIQSAPEPVASR
jgi:outer membrane protein OmpA-like peptidoglycan-associated protein